MVIREPAVVEPLSRLVRKVEHAGTQRPIEQLVELLADDRAIAIDRGGCCPELFTVSKWPWLADVADAGVRVPAWRRRGRAWQVARADQLARERGVPVRSQSFAPIFAFLVGPRERINLSTRSSVKKRRRRRCHTSEIFEFPALECLVGEPVVVADARPPERRQHTELLELDQHRLPLHRRAVVGVEDEPSANDALATTTLLDGFWSLVSTVEVWGIEPQTLGLQRTRVASHRVLETLRHW